MSDFSEFWRKRGAVTGCDGLFQLGDGFFPLPLRKVTGVTGFLINSRDRATQGKSYGKTRHTRHFALWVCVKPVTQPVITRHNPSPGPLEGKRVDFNDEREPFACSL